MEKHPNCTCYQSNADISYQFYALYDWTGDLYFGPCSYIL